MDSKLLMEIVKVCKAHGNLTKADVYMCKHKYSYCKECRKINTLKSRIKNPSKYLRHAKDYYIMRQAKEHIKYYRSRNCDLCGKKYESKLIGSTFCQKCRNALYAEIPL